MKTRAELIAAAAEHARFKPTCPHILKLEEILNRALPKRVAAKSHFRFMFGQLRQAQRDPQSVAWFCYAWTRS